MAVQKILVELIEANPYQPLSRVNVDPGTAEKFGKSILEHGILQAPLVRPRNGHFQCADGHLRLAGVRWIQGNPKVAEEKKKEYRLILCDIQELTDQQMADCVLEANTVRQDLTPIDLATLYKKYLEDFKISQTELARRHNCSQGEIANTIRLLELPAPIQEAIIAQEITDTHGRQLLRLNVVPGMQTKMFERCIKDKPSVSRLSDDINSTLWQNTKSLNPKSDFSGDRPEFNVETCKDCEKRTTAARPYGQQKKEDRCLDPECWEKKNAAAVQEKIRAEQAAVAKQSKAKKAQKIFSGKELSYDQRKEIRRDELDNPEECKTCSKKALYKYDLTSEGKPETVCIDRACYRKKQTKKTKDSNKLKKAQDNALTEDLGKFFLGVHQNPKGCLEVIARHVVKMVSAEGRMDICKMFTVPTLTNGRMDVPALRAALHAKTLDELLQITVAAIFEKERRQYHGDYSIELTAELKRDQAIILGIVDKLIAEITRFQEAECRGCSYCEREDIIGTGEECCMNSAWAKKIDDDGHCKGRRPKGKIEPQKESVAQEA